MISTLTGQVQQVSGDSAIINVGGVGYQVFMPLTSLEEISRTNNEEVMIHTHLNHKEDTMVLFGFLHPEDKALFQQIIGVSGIGPKTALAILSVLSTENFRLAIINEQAKTLTKVPGIGLKSAQRLILELKSKIKKPAPSGEEGIVSPSFEMEDGKEQPIRDAIAALVALGYQTDVAAEIVEKVWHSEPGLNVPDLVRRSLKHLMR